MKHLMIISSLFFFVLLNVLCVAQEKIQPPRLSTPVKFDSTKQTLNKDIRKKVVGTSWLIVQNESVDYLDPRPKSFPIKLLSNGTIDVHRGTLKGNWRISKGTVFVSLTAYWSPPGGECTWYTGTIVDTECSHMKGEIRTMVGGMGKELQGSWQASRQ